MSIVCFLALLSRDSHDAWECKVSLRLACLLKNALAFSAFDETIQCLPINLLEIFATHSGGKWYDCFARVKWQVLVMFAFVWRCAHCYQKNTLQSPAAAALRIWQARSKVLSLPRWLLDLLAMFSPWCCLGDLELQNLYPSLPRWNCRNYLVSSSLGRFKFPRHRWMATQVHSPCLCLGNTDSGDGRNENARLHWPLALN